MRGEYIADALHVATGIMTCFVPDGTGDEVSMKELFVAGQRNPGNPLNTDADLRTRLLRRAAEQDFPVILMDAQEVIWLSMRVPQGTLLGGPVSIRQLDTVSQHRFYRSYGIPQKLEQPVAYLPFIKLLSMLKLAAAAANGTEVGDDMLVFGNNLIQNNLPEMLTKQVTFELSRIDEDASHHAYQEEEELLTCISAGEVEKAYECQRAMIDRVGKMSGNAVMQWYNLAVSAITLNTRAAIAGGLPPAEAYQLSDFFMQQLNPRATILEIQNVMNNALIDFARRVRERGEHASGYIEKSRVYIAKHYKEKIYLSDVADALGISEGHLSRLFPAETGETFQTYLLRFRLERAANLLRFSDRPISEICSYVGIPSQSYFGEQFRRFYHESPRRYRSSHQVAEWKP